MSMSDDEILEIFFMSTGLLVVDENKKLLRFMQRYIWEYQNIEVSIAKDEQSAIEGIINFNKPLFIVLNQDLPSLNITAFFEKLLKNDFNIIGIVVCCAEPSENKLCHKYTQKYQSILKYIKSPMAPKIIINELINFTKLAIEKIFRD